MKRFRWMVFAGLLLASSARAITFGVGCANPCGQEIIALGETAVCEVVIGRSVLEPPLTVDSVRLVLTDADGTETLTLAGTPHVLAPGEEAVFPVTVQSDAADMVGEVFVLQAQATLTDGSVLHPLFPGQLRVVASDLCTVTTTTFPTPTTTVTTTTLPQTTTTTVPPPPPTRPECEHSNGHGVGLLRKCGNLR